MLKVLKKSILGLICICVSACSLNVQDVIVAQAPDVNTTIVGKTIPQVGASQYDAYLPSLKDKKVAVVANATSMIGGQHLIDVLLDRNVDVIKVFAPEHGFRGQKDAGEIVNDEVDAQTGLAIISLYGKNKKPSPQSLQNIDVLVFDIQDVGVRFYTYLSTLHYVMEACAENSVPMILLDRPNPNGFYIDGPVLKSGYESFIGLHPVPLVYGMTIGEYGQMINGEGWLKNGVKCDLSVVKIKGYAHETRYNLPIKPSPNLPNMTSIYLYPSLALFEGTVVSVGRGTEFPFQAIGHPNYLQGDFQFTPLANVGAKTPKLNGQSCNGLDLRDVMSNTSRPTKQISLTWLMNFYEVLPDQENFFLKNNFFNKLAGNDLLMGQIKQGQSQDEIRASWRDDLKAFGQVRERYLIYD